MESSNKSYNLYPDFQIEINLDFNNLELYI